jgi:RAT1-interacting protein
MQNDRGLCVFSRALSDLLFPLVFFFIPFSESPHGKPDPSEPLVEGEELCCMFRSAVGDVSLLYGAEVDGLFDHDAGLSPENLVEVKVSREIQHRGQETTYKRLVK